MRGKSRAWRGEGAIEICPKNTREAKIGAQKDDGVCNGNEEMFDRRLERLVPLFDILGCDFERFTSRVWPVCSVILVNNSKS